MCECTRNYGFDDGFSCFVTPDHEFYLADGTLARVDELDYNSKLWQQSSSMVENSTSAESTGGIPVDPVRANASYTAQFGLRNMVRYLKEHISTIKTEILTTMIYQISKLWGLQIINDSIKPQRSRLSMQSGTWKHECGQKRLNGMGQRQGESGIRSMEKKLGHSLQGFLLYVLNVVKKVSGNKEITNIVQTNVIKDRSVVGIQDIIPMNLKEPVYCLNVPGPHNFCLGNGVLVRNCYDALAYGCRSRPFVINLEDRYNMDMDSYREQYMRAREESGASVVDPGYCG